MTKWQKFLQFLGIGLKLYSAGKEIESARDKMKDAGASKGERDAATISSVTDVLESLGNKR